MTVPMGPCARWDAPTFGGNGVRPKLQRNSPTKTIVAAVGLALLAIGLTSCVSTSEKPTAAQAPATASKPDVSLAELEARLKSLEESVGALATDHRRFSTVWLDVTEPSYQRVDSEAGTFY